MNDQATSDEQPPYWQNAEAMDFRELLKFYDHAWEALSDLDPDTDLPRSKEDFERLADLLDSKLNSQRESLKNVPRRSPTYPGYMSFYFEPSDELREAKERLAWLKNRSAEAPYDPSLSKSEVDDLRQQVRDLQREVEMREEGERESYPERYASYLESRNAYDKEARLYQAESARARKIKKRLDSQASFVEKRRKRIARTFKFGAGIPVGEVPWSFLPKSESSEPYVNDVFRHYEGLRSRNLHIEYDMNRIKQADLLGPNKYWKPKYGIKDYLILTFDHTPKALMESPIYGNAAYVISDWKRQSRLSKRELIDLANQSDEVVRIPHQGNWPEKLKRELGIK